MTTSPASAAAVFELLGRPAIERALHRGAVVVAAEQLERAGAMMRQVGVQPDPAAVAAAVEAGDLVAMLGAGRRRRAVALAAELDRRVRACRR